MKRGRSADQTASRGSRFGRPSRRLGVEQDRGLAALLIGQSPWFRASAWLHASSWRFVHRGSPSRIVIAEWEIRNFMLCCSSGACRRARFRLVRCAPLCLVRRAPLRFVCRVPLRFVHRAPLRLVRRAPLRFVCRAPLRFVTGADSRSIRAPLRRRPRRHLGCHLKRYLSFVSSTFVRCLERNSCAISKAISGALSSAVG